MEGLTFTKKNPEEGEETTASCSWTGSPDPEVTWFKDDSPLVETDLPSRMRITTGREGDTLSSSLEIDAVELSDTGQYTCNVSNPVKHISRVNRLEVQGVCVSVHARVCVCVACSYCLFPPSTHVMFVCPLKTAKDKRKWFFKQYPFFFHIQSSLSLSVALLSPIVAVGISAGGAGFVVLVTVVVVLLCCVWHCARRNSTGGEGWGVGGQQYH